MRVKSGKEQISDKELDYFTDVHPPESHAYLGLTGEDQGRGS